MFERLFGRGRAKAEAARNLDLLDLTDPTVIAGFAEMARATQPTQSVCPLRNGGMLLMNPDDVKAAFSQKGYSNAPSRFSAIAPRNAGKYVAAQVAANIPPFLDAPRHTIVRKWLSKSVFATLEAFEGGIGKAADTYIATVPGGEARLLVEEIGRGFVTGTISDFVGVSLTPEELKRFTAALFKLFAPIHDAQEFEATNEALSAARKALALGLAARQDDGAPCLFQAMAEWAHLLEALDLSEDELTALMVDNALLALADGVENVEAAIGEVMVEWCALDRGARPEITEVFVRACIHKATPGQTIARIAVEDMHIAGQKLAQGSPVFLSLAGANAREAEGADYSFGLGRHRCIGERLAVAMIEACSSALAARDPEIEASDLRFEPVFGHRWMRGVRVVLT